MVLSEKTASRVASLTRHLNQMTSTEEGGAEAQARDDIVGIRRREDRAPVNFAPPDVSRLGQPFQRPRRTYLDSRACDQPNQLCEMCESIDFLALFRDGIPPDCTELVPLERGIPLGYSDRIYSNARCPVCRLVVDIGDTNIAGDDREVEFWSLKPVSGHEVLTCIDKKDDPPAQARQAATATSAAIYLAVVRSIVAPPGYGFAYRTITKDSIYIGLFDQGKLTGRQDFTLRLHDAQANLETIKTWLNRCACHETCQRTSPPPPPEFKLRVLDLNTLQIIQLPPSAPYIALSYVLGQTPSIEQHDNSYELSTLPPFFRDAIHLAKALQHRYIWTDYLCIPNTDPIQRGLDINRMGQIYRHAYATIIDAASPAASHGIPGLSNSPPRMTWQRSEPVGAITLTTTLPSLEMAVKTSVWATRGWTFQEGLMSPRCIVFGPEQAYYECAADTWCESLIEHTSGTPSAAFAPVLRDPFLPVPANNENAPATSNSINSASVSASSINSSLYWSLVRDYTSRHLTQPSDSLRAFHGFFEAFVSSSSSSSSSSSPQTSFLWGLPLDVNLPRNLLWEHGPWAGPPVRRRTGFPSWAWAGWGGSTFMHFPIADDEGGQSTEFTMEWVYDERSAGVAGDAAGAKEESGSWGSGVLDCAAFVAVVRLSAVGLVAVEGDERSSFVLDCGLEEAIGFHARECEYMEVGRAGKSTHGLLLRGLGDGEIEGDGDGGFRERIGSGFMSVESFEKGGPRRMNFRLG